MNPIYAVMESQYRWLILAGIAFIIGTFGAMAMLAYAWPHALDRIWLLAGLLVSVMFLCLAARDWLQADEPRSTSRPDHRAGR
jgi:hypothetical protein